MPGGDTQIPEAQQELAVPSFSVVQLFASQVEGRIYIYELYDSNYFSTETIILWVTLGNVEGWGLFFFFILASVL